MRALVLYALEPVDSDVDLEDPVQRRELYRRHGLVLAVIAAGGVLGTLLRYQLGLWWPAAAPPDFPWTTLTINLTGSLLLGALMVLLTERTDPHPLTRLFLGTGVLGGYTTFSTFTVDIVVLLRDGHAAIAGGYLLGTTIGALLATIAGMSLARNKFGAARPPARTVIDPSLGDPTETDSRGRAHPRERA